MGALRRMVSVLGLLPLGRRGGRPGLLMGFSLLGVVGALGLLYTVGVVSSLWYDDLVQWEMDRMSGLFDVDEPSMPDDAWFAEVEPVTPEEPDWFVAERAEVYAVRVGG